ncbi:staygreen family protein [Bacillus tianshenii]|nr:staygreen family protein [Bacillus tianshenii]
MTKLNPNKLNVTFFGGTSATSPLIPRYYTLTHSDLTAELFLMIGPYYRFDKIDRKLRDEVLGQWIYTGNKFVFPVMVYVGGEEYGIQTASIRYQIFKRELPLALEAIRYGDRELFNLYPQLDDAPIIVYFQSSYPQFHTAQNFGTFRDYRYP